MISGVTKTYTDKLEVVGEILDIVIPLHSYGRSTWYQSTLQDL